MEMPKLDEKSRLTLPSRFRIELTNDVTVVCEQERCLSVYPREVLNRMMNPIYEAPSTFRQVREYQRWSHSRAEDANPDKQGRITITPVQRLWAGLDKEVVVIGAGNRIEIWNPERWIKYAESLDEKFADFDGEIVPRTPS
jgi:MraZ protein